MEKVHPLLGPTALHASAAYPVQFFFFICIALSHSYSRCHLHSVTTQLSGRGAIFAGNHSVDIIVRLRDPEGKSVLQHAEVDGGLTVRVDSETETVRVAVPLAPGSLTFQITATLD